MSHHYIFVTQSVRNYGYGISTMGTQLLSVLHMGLIFFVLNYDHEQKGLWWYCKQWRL